MMFCSKCGNPIQDGAKFCTNCGVAVASDSYVQEEKSPVRDCENGAGKSSAVLDWLTLLLWGSLACSVLSDTISNTPFWSSAGKFIEFVAENAAFGLLTIYVLKGARWARISCYIWASFLLLLTGYAMFNGETLRTLYGDGGTVSLVLTLLDLIGFVAGSVVLLASNTDAIFPNGKEASKNGWAVCLVFWALVLGGVLVEVAIEANAESSSEEVSLLDNDDFEIEFADENTNDAPKKEEDSVSEDFTISFDDEDKRTAGRVVRGASKVVASKAAKGALEHSAPAGKAIAKEGMVIAKAICLGVLGLFVGIVNWLWNRFKRIFGGRGE